MVACHVCPLQCTAPLFLLFLPFLLPRLLLQIRGVAATPGSSPQSFATIPWLQHHLEAVLDPQQPQADLRVLPVRVCEDVLREIDREEQLTKLHVRVYVRLVADVAVVHLLMPLVIVNGAAGCLHVIVYVHVLGGYLQMMLGLVILFLLAWIDAWLLTTNPARVVPYAK